MIGIHVAYEGAGLSPDRRVAFSRALGFGTRAPRTRVLGRMLLVGDSHAQTAAGEIVLFSGHIQNRAWLTQELGLVQTDDATLYAAACNRWGANVDLKIVGEYATITAAADGSCIRLSASPISCMPLHYWHDAERFVVASRTQALFDTGAVKRVVDEHKIADSLFLNYNNPEHGWFVGVKRLPAGTSARVSKAGVACTRYHTLKDLPNIRLRRDEDYVEAADSLLRQAMQATLQDFDAPAVSLSGGLDSQAVAAYAIAERPSAQLTGLTSVPETNWDGIVPANRFGDERDHVRALCAMHPQLNVRWIDAAGCSFDSFQSELFRFALMAPRNAMNLHWVHAIRQQAKRENCDVVLTGALGNVSFSYSGDQAYAGWFRRAAFRPLFRELLAEGRLWSMPRRFMRKAVKPSLPHGLSSWIDRLRNRPPDDPFDSWCPMRREYAEEMNVAERAEAAGFDPLFRPLLSSRILRARMIAMADSEGPDLRLALHAIHGIPTRDPTAYRPLVEFCLGIPDDQYLRNGQKRWLALRLLQAKVPKLVLSENRRGLQAADWHLRLSRQREALIEEIDWLSEDPAIDRRLNLHALRQALSETTDRTPGDQKVAARLQLALVRGLTTARFIRQLEGRNR